MSTNAGQHGVTRHAGPNVRSTHGGYFDGARVGVGAFDPTMPGVPFAQVRDGEQAAALDIGPGAVDGVTHILPGSIPTGAFDPAVPGSPLDTTAPAQPQGVSVVPGFRGFAISWTPANAPDLGFYEIRYAPDLAGAPDTGQWAYIKARISTLFVPGLVPDLTYWVQVRTVDLTGNTVTSDVDSTAVNYLTSPEAGWTTAISVVPLYVGTADIAAGSVTAEHIAVSGLSADQITAGTLELSPMASFADGIRVLDAGGVEIGRWDEFGIKIADPTNAARFVLIDSGQVKFTTTGGASFDIALTPDGLLGDAIRIGALPGGHNLVLNSSFELADFAAAPNVQTFTSTASVPGWNATYRTSVDNVTEGTELSITTGTY